MASSTSGALSARTSTSLTRANWRASPVSWRTAAQRHRLVAAHAVAAPSDISQDAYTCLGVSVCFEKGDGRLKERLVIEPLSASSLECMAAGAKTSFKSATGVTFATATARDKSGLPEIFQDAVFCDQWDYRLVAATRTWSRPHALDNLISIVPLGEERTKWNFSLDDKRVMNVDNEVNDADNVKQDMSIDVYGRKKKEEAAAALSPEAPPPEAVKAQEEEELDQLLQL